MHAVDFREQFHESLYMSEKLQIHSADLQQVLFMPCLQCTVCRNLHEGLKRAPINLIKLA